jgi:hypothetical protein
VGAALHTWSFLERKKKKGSPGKQSSQTHSEAQVMSVTELVMEKTSSVSGGEPYHRK